MRSDADTTYVVWHEDWQRKAFVDWVARYWHQYQQTPLPPVTAVRGEVSLRVRQGRWVALCPDPDCGGAMVASRVTPIFICVYCGSPENLGHWYAAPIPAAQAAIEAQLLRRPAKTASRAYNRNWEPEETVADLQRENAAHQIGA